MREGGRLGSWCVGGGAEPRGVMFVEAGVSREGCNEGNWCAVDGGPGERSSADEVNADSGGGGGGL